MKTNECKFSNNTKDFNAMLQETEKCGQYINLDRRQQLQLRLLAEEMMGMMHSVLGDFAAKFWIETQGKKIELHLRACSNMGMTPSERDALISVSSDGKNAAAKGFMGKLRQLFEGGLYYGNTGYFDAGEVICTGVEYDSYMMAGAWSLQQYKLQMDIDREKNLDVWDELEKSIVANIADDVIVGVRGDDTEMIIKKDFSK